MYAKLWLLSCKLIKFIIHRLTTSHSSKLEIFLFHQLKTQLLIFFYFFRCFAFGYQQWKIYFRPRHFTLNWRELKWIYGGRSLPRYSLIKVVIFAEWRERSRASHFQRKRSQINVNFRIGANWKRKLIFAKEIKLNLINLWMENDELTRECGCVL